MNTHLELQQSKLSQSVNPTFNNNENGAELLPLCRFTVVKSSILHDSVFDQDGLIVVKRIKQIESLIIIFKIQTHVLPTIRLSEPEGIGRDLVAGWEMTPQAKLWA